MLHGFYSWDEWVQENRVLKFNDSNVQKQKELAKQYSAKNKKGLFAFNFISLYSWSIRNNKIYLNRLYCAVPASKPKKPDTLTASKDSDSRASTPSKEVTPVEKTTPALNTSTSSSRGRAPKSSTASSAASTPSNQEQNTTTRELKRGAPERDSRDEGPKYVYHFISVFFKLAYINWFNFADFCAGTKNELTIRASKRKNLLQ